MPRRLLWLAVTVAVSATAEAHHAISAVYDSGRRATIEGVVTAFQFVNPHPLVLMDVTGPDGHTNQWQLEMDNRFELVSIGMTADTLQPGDRLVVTGSLARQGQHALYVRRLDRAADGFQYEQVGSSPRIRPGRPRR